MSEKSIKIRKYIERILLIVILFLVIFIALFFLVNLDLNPNKNSITSTDKSAPIVDMNTEIKSKLGSTTFSVESYSEWINNKGLDKTNNGLDADPDKDGLPNYLEYVYGTDPLNADTDGDKYTDKQEIDNGYDPDAALGNPQIKVEISITKLGLEEVPMIWSKTEIEKEMLSDLESGVSHYAQTTAPGQNGNAIISGHSSNYIWAKGNYNYIFKDLNNLEKGDSITIKTIQKNGRVITYHYVVRGKYIDAPDDERIFETTETPTLTLSTCWPLGTNFKRLIIKAELVK